MKRDSTWDGVRCPSFTSLDYPQITKHENTWCNAVGKKAVLGFLTPPKSF